MILIDHFNLVPAAREYLRSVEHEAVLSVITWAEVFVGFPSETAAAPAKALLDRFTVLPIDLEVADLAARLRRDHRWRLPDALQAALSVHHGLLMATRNTKDFSPRQHPFVVVPYSR